MGWNPFRRSAAAPETRDAAWRGGYTIALGAGAYTGPVTPPMAEGLSAVVACVDAIGGAIGALPARVYRSLGDEGRTEAPNHPLARLIRRGPNRHQTWRDWILFTMSEVLLYGNSLSIVEWDGAGRPVALRPVPWRNVTVTLLPSGSLAYDVIGWLAPPGVSGPARRFLDTDVWHCRDRSDDGYVGRSRLSRASAALQAALGVQGFATNVWSNSATPSGMLTVPPNLSPEGKRRLEAHIAHKYTGTDNAGRILFVDNDTKWTSLGISPEDAETLDSRRFATEDVCRLFGVPPPIVADYSNNTFTNAATASVWFATNTLAPWCRALESEFARSVLDPSGEFHLEIDLSGMTRGDFATRWSAMVAAVGAGILTADEVREQEGYGPKPADALPGDPGEGDD
jgi:HK97 family phage portal protein